MEDPSWGTPRDGNVLYPGVAMSRRVLVGSEMNDTFLVWGTTSPTLMGGDPRGAPRMRTPGYPDFRYLGVVGISRFLFVFSCFPCVG